MLVRCFQVGFVGRNRSTVAQLRVVCGCHAALNVRVMGVKQSQLPSNLNSNQQCFVLAHSMGYANLSSVHYLAVKNTANKGACCSLCQKDPRCVAWTRVAGD